jgi:Ca2+-binding EF-hand superfamily protein
MGCGSSKHAISEEVLNVDTNNDGLISRDELSTFIARNEKLYLMLSVNLNIPEAKCRDIATEVAYQMSKRQKREMSLRDLSESTRLRNPTVQEFQDFLNFLDEPTGQQEFFHRTVVTTYDVDNSGYLESEELDKFLEVFYQAGSIFAGDVRLPEKATLKKEVMKQLDINRDGKLQFSELRSLISGGAQTGLSFDQGNKDGK